MRRFIFLLAGFVFFSTSGWANHSNSEFNNSVNNWNFNQTQSFIFMENGIEFSVFQDGQFDFFIPNYGPNVHAGFGNGNVNFSFNTGFNYNPYVQFDSFGAIIQIENTPIFYDHFGRVNQIGSVPIFYNNFGFVHRIGGLRIFYRNNIFWRQRGFINVFNRGYVWRPWHRFYAIPPANFCLISVHPYRQFYAPVRHIYYRPYVNNVRHFNFNRNNPNVNLRANNVRSNHRYVQTPRTRAERQIRSNVERQNREITRTRNESIAYEANDRTNLRNNRNSRSVDDANVRQSTNIGDNNGATIRNNSRERSSTLRTNRNSEPERSITQNMRRAEQVINNNRTTNEVTRRGPSRSETVNKPRTNRKSTAMQSRSTSNRNVARASRSNNNKSTSGRSLSSRSSRTRQ